MLSLIHICGIVAACLAALGNPANMAFCIACFIRDTAGAMGLHQAEVVQYARPEIIGLVLGAFIISVATKEYLSLIHICVSPKEYENMMRDFKTSGLDTTVSVIGTVAPKSDKLIRLF